VLLNYFFICIYIIQKQKKKKKAYLLFLVCYLLGAALKHTILPALSEMRRSLNRGLNGTAVCCSI
jgi:hypothetical protein